MEEPGRLQSMESLGVGHDWTISLSLFTFIHWRRKWQPTPVFLPGDSQGRGSLVGCRLWGHTESDMTEATQQQQQQALAGMGGQSEQCFGLPSSLSHCQCPVRFSFSTVSFDHNITTFKVKPFFMQRQAPRNSDPNFWHVFFPLMLFFLLRITLIGFLIQFLHRTQGSIHHLSLSPFSSLPYFKNWTTNKHTVAIDSTAIVSNIFGLKLEIVSNSWKSYFTCTVIWIKLTASRRELLYSETKNNVVFR